VLTWAGKAERLQKQSSRQKPLLWFVEIFQRKKKIFVRSILALNKKMERLKRLWKMYVCSKPDGFYFLQNPLRFLKFFCKCPTLHPPKSAFLTVFKSVLSLFLPLFEGRTKLQ